MFSCQECLSLAPVLEANREDACVWCEQVAYLLSWVVELEGKLERIRSIGECEKWSNTPQG